MKKLAFVLFFMTQLAVMAQKSYGVGDQASNFKASEILNYSEHAAVLNDLKGDITIIDFFGTWCAPCIRALPILEELQQQSPGLKVILVSIEKKSQLKKFLSGHPAIKFPVIVDEGSSISNLFQPPSYPYTLVLNNNNKIIAITEAADITSAKLKNWHNDNSTPHADQATLKTQPSVMPSAPSKATIINPVIALSETFIYAAKTGNQTTELVAQLKALNLDTLANSLVNDAQKKSFWINLYNGYTQLILKKNPGKYADRKSFFKAKQIEVAAQAFSLDDIEHGILRRSKVKWSLGYFNKLFPSKTEKKLRVKYLDYRIHFALNCGAKSCPPIAFYTAAKIEEQLNLASRAYMGSEAVYNVTENTLELPAILSWFRRDFGGKKKIIGLAKSYGIVPVNKQPHIDFKTYDWNLYLDNYKTF